MYQSYRPAFVNVSDFYHMIQDQDEIDSLLDLPNRITLEKLHQYWFRGAYPEPWIKNSSRFTRLWGQNYIQTCVNRDIIALFGLLSVEIKYGQHIQSRQLRRLRDFIREQGCRFGPVSCNVEQVIGLDEQVTAIPFGCL